MNFNVQGRQNCGARILIVEDDREMCRFLSELLVEEGYEVAVVYDGPSSMEKHKQKNI